MTKYKLCISIIIFIFVFFIIIKSSALTIVKADEKDASYNRFNVVIVLDASNSMNYTDPSKLRYEAVSQFISLLAEKGNYLGGVVFSNHVEVQQNPSLISTQQDKDHVVETLKSFMSNGATNDTGYTNIGEGLSTAVDLLISRGNEELPSVIIFLSDGNTDMPSTDEYTVSIDQKTEAIQKARDNNISVYAVCLNANGSADSNEMKQISEATGGSFQEVVQAADLQEVFNVFYNLIYGTSTILLVDDVFPSNGKIEKDFYIPGIGVEEVNIIIYGKTSGIELYNPDNEKIESYIKYSDTCTMIKITNVVAGEWRLIAQGNPTDPIKINMVYNTNLTVELFLNKEENILSPSETVTVKAYLKSGDIIADNEKQYMGYSAKLQILNAYEEIIDSISMEIVKDHFEIDYIFNEGIYYLNTIVSGNYLEKTSNSIGPLTVALDKKESNNTAPYPVDNSVEETVYLWPFIDNSYILDLKTLAVDNEDTTLKYKIISSSFMEETDYSVSSDDILTVRNYSLSKGAFTIRAIDSGGLSCEIELIIQSYNVGIIIFIGIGIIIVTAIIILAVLLRIKFYMPFKGTVFAQSYCNGKYRGEPMQKRRGRIRLSDFGMEPTGLNYNKCYFQATGKEFVYLIVNKPVLWNEQRVKKIKVYENEERIQIQISESDFRMICTHFHSLIKEKTGNNA